MSSRPIEAPAAGGGVVLPDGRSASALLHETLLDSVRAFPDLFVDAAFPESASLFRSAYPAILPRFEAARVAAPARAAIARRLARVWAGCLQWADDAGRVGLHEALADTVAPLRLKMHAFGGRPGWTPAPVYRGERWSGAQIAGLGAALAERDVITPAAAEALAWVAEHALQGGVLDLSGRRIAVLGANAEMAPTRHWLEAGAEVLWIDIAPPPADWFEGDRRGGDALAGRLHWCPEGADLLTQPREILATLRAFAAEGPLDLGLYAYAPGRARELRLTGVMNALVEALPPESIASVTLLVSPTTPTALDARDLEATAARRARRPAWEAALSAIGLLGRGDGFVRSGDGAATRTVVSIQGASYQAAQYLGKIAVAEAWATHGQVSREAPAPLRVSANTAAITRTRSLDHPVFAAAFGGAGAFGVETFTPRQSRCVNGLLAVADWLVPERPRPGAVRVHGGIHTLPFPLESAMRVAAGFGFARSPRLLRGLLPG
ncbi:MAG: hypothetical protein V2I63_10270 [Pseudomonadales bacterium]|nr:hypothetical protein [Pseudomonadales bacterium]